MKPTYSDNATRALGRADPVMRRLIGGIAGCPSHPSRRRVHDAVACDRRPADFGQGGANDLESLYRSLRRGPGPRRARRATRPRARRPDAAAELRTCGLSARKADYLRDLARHFTAGALDPSEWPLLDDEALIERLTDVRGIGRWTAEMFLIFHEMRADVFPVDDIGLQNAIARHYNDDERLPVDQMREIAVPWQPWRSVATWYLWRSLDPIPVEY